MHARRITDPARIASIAVGARRVAVLGIKTTAQRTAAAYYVAEYLASDGVEVVPVPVYYPEVTEILGRAVVRRVADAPPPLDIVCVFRRSEDVAAHLGDLLAARPACVWLQLGISDPPTEEALAEAGIDVVADRCLMVERQRGAAAR